jgi:hypothetical protein
MYKKYQKETYIELKKSNVFNDLIKKIIEKERNKFFIILKKKTHYTDSKKIIDIGTTPNLSKFNNKVLDKLKNNKNLTILSNLNCKILSKKYPNIKNFIKCDIKKNNLRDSSFDIVHSNATIEHIGSYKNQLLFIKECVRISKKFIFIQTPNRFFPIDFHTLLPFVHWLPKYIHRKVLKLINLNFYSKEENLNLLSKKNLNSMCKDLCLKKFEIIEHKFFFLTSNLILIIRKIN